MKKDKLEMALHQPVVLHLKDHSKALVGYLVRDRYRPKGFSILPLDISEGIISFSASYVKKYYYISSGYLVKWGDWYG